MLASTCSISGSAAKSTTGAAKSTTGAAKVCDADPPKAVSASLNSGGPAEALIVDFVDNGGRVLGGRVLGGLVTTGLGTLATMLEGIIPRY